MFGCCWNYGRRGDSADCLLHVTGSQMGKVYLVGGIECQPFNVPFSRNLCEGNTVSRNNYKMCLNKK